MTWQSTRPRKQRNRQHIIADQSVNHVERFIIDEGHFVQRLTADYGYDLVMMTYDEQGYAEAGLVFLQLKASETLTPFEESYAFDLDIRDYNLWRIERMSVILVLFDAAKRRAYWLHVQHYFEGNPARLPRKGAKTVRVWVGKHQVVNRRAVAKMRMRKENILVHYRGGSEHA
jgi:hypothetical protein